MLSASSSDKGTWGSFLFKKFIDISWKISIFKILRVVWIIVVIYCRAFSDCWKDFCTCRCCRVFCVSNCGCRVLLSPVTEHFCTIVSFFCASSDFHFDISITRAGEVDLKVKGLWNTEKYYRPPWLADKKNY